MRTNEGGGEEFMSADMHHRHIECLSPHARVLPKWLFVKVFEPLEWG